MITTKLYRKYVSQAIRDKIYEAFLGRLLLFFRNFKEFTEGFFYFSPERDLRTAIIRKKQV